MPDEKVNFKSPEPSRDASDYSAKDVPVPKNGDVYADQREQRAEAEAASEEAGAEEVSEDTPNADTNEA